MGAQAVHDHKQEKGEALKGHHHAQKRKKMHHPLSLSLSRRMRIHAVYGKRNGNGGHGGDINHQTQLGTTIFFFFNSKID